MLRRFSDAVAADDDELAADDDFAPDALRVATWPRSEAATESILLPARETLHLHALWELERLPRAQHNVPEGWQPTAEDLRRDPAATWQDVVAGTPTQKPETAFFLLGWSAVRAFNWLRTHLLIEHLGSRGFARRSLLEAFARPPVVWVRGDAEHPELATSTAREWLSVRFTYDGARSIYVPEEITWLRRPNVAPEVTPDPPTATAPSEPALPEVPIAMRAPVGICAEPPENLTKALVDPQCAVELGEYRIPLPSDVTISLFSTEVHALPGKSASVLLRVENAGSEAALLDFAYSCGLPVRVTLYDARGDELERPTVCTGDRAQIQLPPKTSSWLTGSVRAVDKRTGDSLARGRYRFVVYYEVGLEGPKTFEGVLVVK